MDFVAIYTHIWQFITMKLKEWSRLQGISYKTAWRWVKQGKMPIPYEQTATGTILVEAVKETLGQVALYARVSGSDQKSDMDRQLSRLLQYANNQGWMVGKAVTKIGSGLNGHRPKLIQLLADPKIETIVVERKDRLMPFGYEYVESALAAQERRVVSVDPGEVKDDLVQDMIEVLTSFCARLYGRRSAKHKVKKAIEVIGHDD